MINGGRVYKRIGNRIFCKQYNHFFLAFFIAAENCQERNSITEIPNLISRSGRLLPDLAIFGHGELQGADTIESLEIQPEERKDSICKYSFDVLC